MAAERRRTVAVWQAAACAGAILAFLAIAWAVAADGSGGAFDRLVLTSLHGGGDPIGPPWLEEAARDLTSLGGHTLLTILAAIVIGSLLLRRRRAMAVYALAAIASGMLLSSGLKQFYGRDRPDLVEHAARVFTPSFPSGHALLTAVVFLTLATVLARAAPTWRMTPYAYGVAAFLTLAVGASRVYLGVHWPTDVLAGWCAGTAWAMACAVAAARFDVR